MNENEWGLWGLGYSYIYLFNVPSIYLFRFWYPDVCLRRGVSRLPNGVMLPVEYTPEYGAQVFRSTAFGMFADIPRYFLFFIFVMPLFFHSILLCCHPSLFYFIHPHLYILRSINLGISAEKNPYRPDSASGKSVGLAHCRIGLVAFYSWSAPPHPNLIVSL